MSKLNSYMCLDSKKLNLNRRFQGHEWLAKYSCTPTNCTQRFLNSYPPICLTLDAVVANVQGAIINPRFQAERTAAQTWRSPTATSRRANSSRRPKWELPSNWSQVGTKRFWDYAVRLKSSVINLPLSVSTHCFLFTFGLKVLENTQ
jgi:hypothetical protein